MQLITNSLNNIGVGNADRDCAAVGAYMEDLLPIYRDVLGAVTNFTSVQAFENVVWSAYFDIEDLVPSEDVSTFHELNVDWFSFVAFNLNDIMLADDASWERMTRPYSDPLDKEFEEIADKCPQEVEEIEDVWLGSLEFRPSLATRQM